MPPGSRISDHSMLLAVYSSLHLERFRHSRLVRLWEPPMMYSLPVCSTVLLQ